MYLNSKLLRAPDDQLNLVHYHSPNPSVPKSFVSNMQTLLYSQYHVLLTHGYFSIRQLLFFFIKAIWNWISFSIWRILGLSLSQYSKNWRLYSSHYENVIIYFYSISRREEHYHDKAYIYGYLQFCNRWQGQFRP